MSRVGAVSLGPRRNGKETPETRAQVPGNAQQPPRKPSRRRPPARPTFQFLPESNRFKKSGPRPWQGALQGPSSSASRAGSRTGARTRRTATCSTKLGVGVGAAGALPCPRPLRPRLSNRARHPKPERAHPCAHPGGSPRFGPPRAHPLNSRCPRISLDPSPGCQGPHHPRPLWQDSAPEYLPRRCRERRVSCRPWYPGAGCRARRGRRESLPRLAERTGRSRLLSARWAVMGTATPARLGGRAAKPGERGAAPSAVCPPVPGALLLHPSRRSPGPPPPPPNPSHRSPAAATGPPPGLPSTSAEAPGAPAQGGLCWSVREPAPSFGFSKCSKCLALCWDEGTRRSVSGGLPPGIYFSFS